MKRRLAFFMSLVMLSAVPMTAYAEEGAPTEAVEEVAVDVQDTVADDGEVTEPEEEPVEINEFSTVDEIESGVFSTETEDSEVNWFTAIVWQCKDGRAHILRFKGTKEEYDIPEILTSVSRVDYTVVELCEKSFQDNPSLNRVGMHDKIEKIGKGTFLNCRNLRKINVGGKLVEIPDDTFKGCNRMRKIFIPKSVKKIGDEAFFSTCNIIQDVYYEGSEQEWKDISIGADNLMLDGARMHYNATKADYDDDNDFGDDPDPNPGEIWGSSGNYALRSTVSRGSAMITYNSVIPFMGNKLKTEYFDISVSYNGNAYTGVKAKINKKKGKIQITKVDPKDKELQQLLRKLTKGKDGLDFRVKAYKVSDSDQVDVKVNKKGAARSVRVKLGESFYRCKKAEYSYDSAGSSVSFNGENLKGSYKIVSGNAAK